MLFSDSYWCYFFALCLYYVCIYKSYVYYSTFVIVVCQWSIKNIISVWKWHTTYIVSSEVDKRRQRQVYMMTNSLHICQEVQHSDDVVLVDIMQCTSRNHYQHHSLTLNHIYTCITRSVRVHVLKSKLLRLWERLPVAWIPSCTTCNYRIITTAW